MATRKEVAELVINISENLDEAEQFIAYIPDIIRHCEKSFLISILGDLKESLESNIELNKTHLLVHSDAEIEQMLNKVDKILKTN